MKKFVLPILISILMVNCKKPEDGLKSLIDLVIEPKGTNCPNGGYKVLTGIDTNNDNILGENEIQQTKYICNGIDGKTTLIAVATEPAGSNCTTGGYKLDSGIDLNANGLLDASEIASSQYICNGLAGSNSLVSVMTEPAGSNCPTGGYKMTSGTDLNKNAILDAAEITSSRYICNGLNGSNSLVTLVTEPASINCPTGGYKLNTGIDLNKNNILDNTEITNSQYVCNGLTGSSSLVSVVAEPAGSNCATGGYKLNSGIDLNKNGVLESIEIKSSQYICNGANGLHYLIKVLVEPASSNCIYGGYRVSTGLDLNNNGQLDDQEFMKTDYICHDSPSLLNGLIAYWPFNGSGADLSGNGHNATLKNMVSTTDRFGNPASAYFFNGFSSYATVADHSALRLSNTNFTLNAWVKLNSYNASHGAVILSKRTSGIASGWNFTVSGYLESPFGVVTYGPGGGNINAWGTSVVGLNNWHMVTSVYTYSSGQLSIYVDGVLDATLSGIPTANGAITAALNIGSDSALNDYYLHGTLDDLRIYDRALNTYEIQQLYKSGF